MACQICLEDFRDILASDPRSAQILKLCGADTACCADLCSSCLSEHIATTLDSCVMGLLPRVRCPICLVQITKSKWIPRVHPNWSPTITAQYVDLARTALSLIPPCCDASGYTHLPASRDPSTIDEVFASGRLFSGSPPQLKDLLTAFMEYRLDASRVVACVVDAGVPNVETAMKKILRLVSDDERRATLLLSFLYKFPSTFTVCCQESICFNCKGAHDGSVPCDLSASGFDEMAPVPCHARGHGRM